MEDSGIDSDQKALPKGNEIAYEDNISDSSSGSINGVDLPASIHLQRKMGQKVVESKKLHHNKKSDSKKLIQGPALIPIDRLSIPNKPPSSKEQLPLVEWDTDESEEDIHFFPVNRTNVKSELTDTFSIEEFDVSADEDDLNLLSPKPVYQKIFTCPVVSKCCIL